MKVLIGIVVVLLGVAVAGYVWLRSSDSPPSSRSERVADVSKLRVADGFELGLFADNIDNARMLRVTSEGDLLVSAPRAGSVWWLERDLDGDGASDKRRLLLSELKGPNGLDLKDGYLYVAEERSIGRVPFDAAKGELTGAYEHIVEGLPEGGNHWRRPLRFGPDGLMYVVIGSSCNACLEADERYATMLRFTATGESLGIFATGLRNSAGFDWSPADGALYATDNGRDLLGDDFPPCELNKIEEGAFYGWPFANGERVPDPDLGEGRETIIAASRLPVFSFRAHNAPLGILFLRNPAPAYAGTALVALHGSWNRTAKDGYKVVALRWAPNGSVEAHDFLTGFLDGEKVRGRPAELAEASDGTIFVSDDYAKAVYRIVPGRTRTAA